MNGLFTSLFLIAFAALSGQETVWLDASLNPLPSKKKAAYYLNTEFRDSLYAIRIYRLNHVLLMEGFALDEKGQQLEGQSTWYHPNGRVESKGTYFNGKKQGVWKRYDAQGKPKNDRTYSAVNMDTYIFESALVMPSPPDAYAPLNDYLSTRIIAVYGDKLNHLSPLHIQLVIDLSGHITEILIDDRLSNKDHMWLRQQVEGTSKWTPGNNGSQNLNVRVNYLIDLRP